MKLQLENIGMIKNANLQFNGLTVIAGENDTGKTTVGKILFSEIRAYKKMASRFVFFEDKLKPRKPEQSKSGIKFSPENHDSDFYTPD
jgi:predicted ATP-dependent endonuclease of OLD family